MLEATAKQLLIGDENDNDSFFSSSPFVKASKAQVATPPPRSRSLGARRCCFN